MICSAIFASAALSVSGCASLQNLERAMSGPKPIEPTPKADVADADADEATATAAEQQAAATASALTPEEQAAAPPPPLPQPRPLASYGPVGKPRIVAKVERVQFPAWVERAGVKAGMKPGWAIYTGDRILTGADGRVVLAVAGEGKLKVGGSTVVDMTPAYEFTSEQEPPLFTVARGSVQFGAPMVRSGRGGTPLQVRDAISANLIGGTIVIKSDAAEDLIVLIDGSLQVSGPKLNPGTMTQPETYLRVPRAGRALPVREASAAQFARWAGMPEPLHGRPALAAEGTWDVSLNSGYNLRQLETMACAIQRRGIPVEVYPVKEPGKLVWYRVVVRRFASKNDAVSFLGTAKSLGSKEPWVLLPQT